MLTDKDINQIPDLINPFREDNSTPAGYDLTVGDSAFSWAKMRFINISENSSLDIAPGDQVLIWAQEILHLPKNIGGTVHPLVWHMARGIVSSSGTLDPGYRGKILVQFVNLGSRTFHLTHGERLVTLCLHKTDSESISDHRKEEDRMDIRIYLQALEHKGRLWRLMNTLSGRYFVLIIGILLLVTLAVFYAYLDPQVTLQQTLPLISIVSVIGLIILELLKGPKK